MPRLGNKLGLQFGSSGQSSPSYIYVEDGLDVYRKGRRSGYYVIDYSADGGVTYELNLAMFVPTEDLLIINLDQPGGVAGYRQQVRNGALMIDHVLTETGFSGTEGTDWENIDVINGSYWYTRLPTNLTLIPYDENRIDLFWDDAVDAADGLKVYLSTDAGANYIYNSTIAYGVETKSVTGLIPNTTYTFKVVAYHGSDESTGITGSDITYANWWLAGDVPAINAKAAYQPLKAASLAASYINKAIPGTNDAVAVVAPEWNADDGWVFNGVDMVLDPGLVPVTAGQTWSMVARYDGFVMHATIATYIAGEYTSSRHFSIALGYSSNMAMVFGNGGLRTIGTSDIEGYLGFAGNKPWARVTALSTITAGANNPVLDMLIGALNVSGNPSNFFKGNLKCLGVWDKVLTDDEYKAIIYGMYIKDGVNWSNRLDYVYRQKFAALICWNMPTFTNTELSAGNIDPNTFAPTDLDIDDWLDTCVLAGMEVVYLTVKAPDGFMLWPSLQAAAGYDPYTIARTTWYANNGSPDVVGLFVAGCVARGIKPGLYFSIWDLTHEIRTGTDETTDAAAYVTMTQTQLTELLTNYGDIYAIWFDAWEWHVAYYYIKPSVIKNHIRSIQPNCIIISNDHEHPSVITQIEVYETQIDGVIPEGNTRLAEEVQTIRNNAKWYFDVADTHTAADFMTKAEINAKKATVNSRRAVYNLGLQIDKSGHLPAAQKALLESLTT